MIGGAPSGPPFALARTSEPAGTLTFRSGSEVVGVAEALYVRLFVIAAGCMQLVCGLAIVVALVRTANANFVRTGALAVGMALLAMLALRVPARVYGAMRRRPVLSLAAPAIALAALAIDGVLYSPLSYPAAASIAFPAFVCGRRWALAAATLIAVGAITAATLATGFSAVSSVGQGAAGYFVWALVLAGLAERFAQLVMRMPAIATHPATAAPPNPVQNLADDQPPITPEEANPSATPSTPVAPPAAGRLTARQLQILALLADGLRADDIAQRLGINTSTVYRHIERAKKRTGAGSRSELVAAAMRAGILPASTN